MSLQIDRGLFKFDFIDCHAILGVPVDADAKEVRKQYLKIARRLHPDSCKSHNDAEKKIANELLTKLVNPANEQLSRSNRDYLVTLRGMGQRLAAEGGKVSVSSPTAKQLVQAGANLDNVYKSTLKNLALKQYESLDQVLDKTAEISELNMVYLMVKGKTIKTSVATKSTTATPATTATVKTPTPTDTGKTHTATGAGKPPITPTSAKSAPKTTTGAANAGASASQEVSRVDAYIRRAEGYIAKKNFAGGVLELKEALKLEPTNSKCHSLLGLAYLKQNQVSMARVHINQALQLNPNDENALQAKKMIERLTGQTGAGGQPKDGSKSPGKSSGQSGSGGLFGGLFGGKKK